MIRSELCYSKVIVYKPSHRWANTPLATRWSNDEISGHGHSYPEIILEKSDRFYNDVGGATGDEILAEAYQFRQWEHKKVPAFASRLDNCVRMACSRGPELLPDDDAVKRQLHCFRKEFAKGLKIKPGIRKINVKHLQNLSQQLDMVKGGYLRPAYKTSWAVTPNSKLDTLEGHAV